MVKSEIDVRVLKEDRLMRERVSNSAASTVLTAAMN